MLPHTWLLNSILFCTGLHTSDQSTTENEDYLPIHNNSVAFNGYETKEENIAILDDGYAEHDEHFNLVITGAAVGEGINIVNIMIADNDRKYLEQTTESLRNTRGTPRQRKWNKNTTEVHCRICHSRAILNRFHLAVAYNVLFANSLYLLVMNLYFSLKRFHILIPL